jgi:hypothetical protein
MHIERAGLIKNNFLKRVGTKEELFFFIFTDKFLGYPPIGYSVKKREYIDIEEEEKKQV